MKKSLSLCVGFLAALISSVPAWALDGMAVELGHGKHANMGRVAVQWDWQSRWLPMSDWHVGGYWDLALGQWRARHPPAGANRDITEIGLTPVFRLQRNDLAGPYLEAAIGFHLMSNNRIGVKNMSTNFQFGDHVGAGYRFGAKQSFDLAYRYQHLSNAGIKRPNPGINFHQIRLHYHY